MELYEQLKRLRTEQKLTQGELALRIGMVQTSVARYERGATNISSMKAQEIARSMGYHFVLQKLPEEE